MQNRILKITAAVIAFSLIGFLLFILNAFTGNPVSSAIASSKIKAYVKETYPKMDLELSKASYNFKDSDYYMKVQSKTSKDTYFRISWDHGKIRDSYEYDIPTHMTTFERLTNEFNQLIEDVINKDFPYETSIVIGDFGKSDADIAKLTLDMPLDLSNLPPNSGITVYTNSKLFTYEELAKRLLELQAIMNNHNIPISTYSLVLEKTTKEDEKPIDKLYLFDFPAEKIKSENLIEEIKLQQNNYEQEHEK